MNQKPGSPGFLRLRFLWFTWRFGRRFMPHDFFHYLIEVCRVFVAAKFAGGFDEALRLDLRAVEELLGNRTGALVVKPPPRAIGQHAPTEFAGREVFHAPQVTKHLG